LRFSVEQWVVAEQRVAAAQAAGEPFPADELGERAFPGRVAAVAGRVAGKPFLVSEPGMRPALSAALSLHGASSRYPSEKEHMACRNTRPGSVLVSTSKRKADGWAMPAWPADRTHQHVATEVAFDAEALSQLLALERHWEPAHERVSGDPEEAAVPVAGVDLGGVA
jgi:hypothetical protein